jgi:membrane protein
MAEGSPTTDDSIGQRLRDWWVEVRWYFQQMVDQFLTHDCLSSAGTLTYTTLFAIVPLITVGYSIFSIIPQADAVERIIEDFLFQNLIPNSGAVVQEKLLEFSARTRELTWISFLFLFVTAFMMLMTIEKTFNKVWHVPEARSGLQRLLVYWAVLTLAPTFLIVAGFISLYFASLTFLTELNTFGLGEMLLSQAPKLFMTVAFTVIYYAVPNCDVPLKHAFAGGVLTMVCFVSMMWGFGKLAPQLSFNAIYGAFAAVPIFLLWIYLVWVLVLAGLIFVRCLSLKRDLVPTPEPLMVKAARILKLLHDAHQLGGSVSDVDIAQAVRLNRAEHERVIQTLREMKVLQQAERERWVLSRSLRTLTLWDLYTALPEGMEESRLSGINDLPGVVEPIKAITQFGSNEMSVSLETALGALS